jgi:hypothetical protein
VTKQFSKLTAPAARRLPVGRNFAHKYSIERNAVAYDVELHLKNCRNDLLNKSLTHQLSPTQQQQLQQAD